LALPGTAAAPLRPPGPLLGLLRRRLGLLLLGVGSGRRDVRSTRATWTLPLMLVPLGSGLERAPFAPRPPDLLPLFRRGFSCDGYRGCAGIGCGRRSWDRFGNFGVDLDRIGNWLGCLRSRCRRLRRALGRLPDVAHVRA